MGCLSQGMRFLIYKISLLPFGPTDWIIESIQSEGSICPRILFAFRKGMQDNLSFWTRTFDSNSWPINCLSWGWRKNRRAWVHWNWFLFGLRYPGRHPRASHDRELRYKYRRVMLESNSNTLLGLLSDVIIYSFSLPPSYIRYMVYRRKRI